MYPFSRSSLVFNGRLAVAGAIFSLSCARRLEVCFLPCHLPLGLNVPGALAMFWRGANDLESALGFLFLGVGGVREIVGLERESEGQI